jgi:hypothetical protein
MSLVRPAIVFVTVAIAPSVATASPTFPAAVQAALDMPCKPICTTCHTRPEGGLGTARTAFGLAMQGQGLVARSPNSVDGALQKLEASGSDVDTDGVPDIEELRNMDDPNAASTSLECLNETPPEESGGCGVADKQPRHDGSVVSTLGIFLSVLVAARVRRRRAHRAGADIDR